MPIEAGYATIVRYVAKCVVDQLLSTTSLEDTTIRWVEDGISQNQSANNDPGANHLTLNTDDVAMVEYIDRFSEKTSDIQNNMTDALSVFANPKLGIKLSPIHAKSVLELSITLRSKSHSKLKEWKNLWRLNHKNKDPHRYIDVMYNYAIPGAIISYIADAHHLSNEVAPTGDTLSEFVDKYFTEGVITRKNLAGGGKTLAINEEQLRCLMRYTAMPERIERDRESGTNEITFTVEFTYDKPTHLMFEYQAAIHNQRIPSHYLDLFGVPDVPGKRRLAARPFNGSLNLDMDEYIEQQLNPEDIFYDIHDKWLPKTPLLNTLTLAMIPIQLDANDPSAILSVADIKSRFLSDMIEDIMNLSPEACLMPYGFPFLFELWAVGDVTEPVPLRIDNNLTLTAHGPMDLSQRHYLRVSLLTDLTRMPPEVHELLMNNPDPTIELIRHFLPSVGVNVNTGGLIVIGGTTGGPRRISMKSYMSTLKSIKTTSENYKRYNQFQHYLTGYAGIIVRRR